MLNRKIARIDLASRKVEYEEISGDLRRKYLGGRGINMYLLNRLVDRNTDPLGADNPLIFGVGLLTATPGYGTGRMNVSARSPLSGYLADSNMGGDIGAELRFAGFDHLVVTGKSDSPVYLYVKDGRVEIRDASHLWGRDTFETQSSLRNELKDERVKSAVIGIAGEKLVKFSHILSDQKSSAGRGGLGAVMGSKNLKAVAARGALDVRVARPSELLDHFKSACDSLRKKKWIQALGAEGTPLLFKFGNRTGLLSVRNHQDNGMGEEGRVLEAENLKRYSEGMAACFGCIVHCRHRHYIREGKYAGTRGVGPEYGAIGAFGANMGNTDLESVMYASDLCNRLGLDLSSTGAYIGWATELYQRGIINEKDVGFPLEWGAPDSMIRLIEDIAYRRGFGDTLAEGTFARDKIGKGSEKYLMTIKNIPCGGTDERAVKSFALGLAVATRGSDHLRSRPGVDLFDLPQDFINELYGGYVSTDYTSYDGKSRMIWWHELLFTVVDALGTCKFQTVFNSPNSPKWEEFCDLLRLSLGWDDMTPQELMDIGERIYTTERLFINKLGLGRKDDTLPRRYFEEKVSSGLAKDAYIDETRFQQLLDEYYKLHGWDEEGVPTPATLGRLGIT
jgi:aldehyde:ferredoxin oxidoreductase